MMMQGEFDESLRAADAFLRANDRFLVVSHTNPDGDAAGSTFAIGHVLRQLNKQYVLANIDAMPKRFSYLDGYRDIVGEHQLQQIDRFCHVIAVDCADAARFGQLQPYFAEDFQLLNIDHHATNTRFGTINLVHVEAAATAQVIQELVEHMQLPLNNALAECLYTGLLTDTGGFRYQNTTPQVLDLASKLLHTGVNPTAIARVALETVTTSHIEMLKRALATLTIHSSGRVAWVLASLDDLRETGATADDLDGIVRYPVNIEGIEVGILFKQLTAIEYKVSFRSNDVVDVSAVAAIFGGGGHIRAAGCTVRGEWNQVLRDVMAAVERVLP